MTAPTLAPILTPQVDPPALKVQLIKRDLKFGSPTFGQDLITIDILGDDSGTNGVCMLKGFSGFMHAPRTHVKEAWAYQEGTTISDFPRVDERIIDIRLATKGRTAREWEQVDSALWDVLDSTSDAILRVESQSSEPRELKVRLERKPTDAMTYTPGYMKHMVWDIVLIAVDPWWYSRTLESSWTRGNTPLVNGSYMGGVWVENRADQDSWLEWSCATITSTETWILPDALGVYPAGHQFAGQPIYHALPPLTAGKEFLVQTHPLQETLLVMDDSQKWAEMKAEDFEYALPKRTPRTSVAVALIGGTANSTVSVFCIQRWDRAWGGEKGLYRPNQNVVVPPDPSLPAQGVVGDSLVIDDNFVISS